MAGEAPKGKQETAEPDAPKRAPAQPREYVVLRETSEPGADKPRTFELVGRATERTPKAARIAAAKKHVEPDELKSEKGVELRAVSKSAFDSGVGAVKLKVREDFDS